MNFPFFVASMLLMNLFVFHCNIDEMIIVIKNISDPSDELNVRGDVTHDPGTSTMFALVWTRRMEDEGVVELGLPALELHRQSR